MRARWIGLAISAALLVACGGKSSSGIPADEAAELLIDRNWLDLWPQDRDERLNVYRFTPSMGGGVFQDRTLFMGTFELFRYELKEGVIEFNMPQNEQRVTSRYKIERVKGPKPFDLKLTIDPSPRGPEVYYGRTAETGTLMDPFAD
jgi:hypothetical protein